MTDYEKYQAMCRSTTPGVQGRELTSRVTARGALLTVIIATFAICATPFTLLLALLVPGHLRAQKRRLQGDDDPSQVYALGTLAGRSYGGSFDPW